MRNNLKIDGVTIKTPPQFKVELYRITKSARSASGLMNMELIAKKRKFYLTYDSIDGSDLNIILDRIWETDAVFYNFSYVEDNVTKTAVVYTGDIPKELHRTDDANWVWKGVEIHLIER